MEAGKLCFDFGKLIFGGVILVGIIETELSRKPLFWISGFLVLIFLAFGFILFWMATLKK